MEEQEKNKQEKNSQVANGMVVGEQINQEVARLDEAYYKPEYKCGDGNYEDNNSVNKRNRYKKEVFKGKEAVKDPYTNNDLLLKRNEARLKYGDNWREHFAEMDHIEPLHKVYQDHKNDVWLSKDDIKEIANDTDNLKAVSFKQNNAKRDRTNEEYYGDEGKDYRKEKGVKVSKKGRKKAIEDGKRAKADIERKILIRKVENIGTEFVTSGWQGAKSAGTMTAAMSSMNNIVSVIKGEIPPEEALKNVAKDSAISAVTAFGVTGTTAVVARTLSGSNSPFIKSLVKSNVPGQVVSAVMATGGTLMKFCKGEIDTKECIKELGQTGISTITTGYAMAVGQAVIPIPVVGAAVGAIVGAAVAGGLYRDLKAAIDSWERSEREYKEIKRLTDEAIERLKKERIAFEKATHKLFALRAKAINEGYDLISEAHMLDDVDTLGEGLTTLANAFNKDIQYHSMEEFGSMMQDDDVSFEM
ncbi:MAG: hypothetical protein E7197_05920 [Anaerovibrio sp.]|uniref:hypothetical protein n=1 Tax=Anaerovibrio sp. TaxID=1872532 RepID=UPI0025C52C8B|nr:hypothetical protein [Anaerovibrio sp.]MBE6099576.1 hypothetical protein [Anaerovibrio sp.]